MSGKNLGPSRMLGLLGIGKAATPAVVPSTSGGMLADQNYDELGYEAAPLPAGFVPYATLKEARKGKHDAPAA